MHDQRRVLAHRGAVARTEGHRDGVAARRRRLGVKGAGEGGTIPARAAIANAVEDALRPFGARINHLPVTPPRILAAIAGGDRA